MARMRPRVWPPATYSAPICTARCSPRTRTSRTSCCYERYNGGGPSVLKHWTTPWRWPHTTPSENGLGLGGDRNLPDGGRRACVEAAGRPGRHFPPAELAAPGPDCGRCADRPPFRDPRL